MPDMRVISLVRHAERRAEFQRRNAHVDFTFFDAVDGRTLTMPQIRATGLFTPEVESTYDPHAYGCALSHATLWQEAAAGTQPLTIVEDDVVLRHDFAERSAEVLASLPPDWDIVLWGWNFDSVLQVQAMGNGSPVLMIFDQARLRRTLDDFQGLGTSVQPFKLEKAFGLPCYTLSPSGAKRMLERCFPQRPLTVSIPGTSRLLANVGVDVSTHAAYPDVNAFACFPPLAATPNVRGPVR